MAERPSDGGIAALALDSLDFGVIVMDADRRVLVANQSARALAARRDALALDEDHLRLFAGREQQALQAYLHSARREALALALHRSNGKPDYRCLVRPLDAARTRFQLALHEPSATRRLDVSLLRQLYGMTRMESDIVAGLFEGRSVNDLTAQYGISSNTVRTHLKAVFAKCEVNTQAQLLQLIALGPSCISQTVASAAAGSLPGKTNGGSAPGKCGLGAVHVSLT